MKIQTCIPRGASSEASVCVPPPRRSALARLCSRTAALVATLALGHNLPAAEPTEEQLLTETAGFRAMSLSALDAMVPRLSGFISMNCPACDAKWEKRGADYDLFTFTPPAKITCNKCSTSFPNTSYPNNYAPKFYNPHANDNGSVTTADQITVNAHVKSADASKTDAEKQNKYAYYIDGTIDSFANDWLLVNMVKVAQLYALTGTKTYSDRVIFLLERYATHFPKWLVRNWWTEVPGGNAHHIEYYRYLSTGGPWFNNGVEKDHTDTVPYDWTSSRWSWGRWNAEVPLQPFEALKLVRNATESWAWLDGVRERNSYLFIRNGLFKESIENWLMVFPMYYHITNNASQGITNIVQVGRALGVDAWTDYGMDWANRVFTEYHFTRDGGFAESLGYFGVWSATNYEAFEALDGYKGYDLKESKHYAFVLKSERLVDELAFPNGSELPLDDNRHDTFVDPWFRVGGDKTDKSLAKSVSVLRGGYGHVVLGAGELDWQTQAHLTFSPHSADTPQEDEGLGHSHNDSLSLMLWGNGLELFADIGYNRTKYRVFAANTIAHNTVVVDRNEQSGSDTKGNVYMYEKGLNGVSLVQVEAKNSNPGTTRFRRTLLLNSRDLTAPYLVDIFEVKGGKTHDYFLYGPTIHDSTATASVAMTRMSGARPLLASGETWPDLATSTGLRTFGANPGLHYGMFTSVDTASISADFSVDFKVKNPYVYSSYFENPRYTPRYPSFHYEVDPANYPGQLAIGVKSSFFKVRDTTLYLGQTLSLLRGGLEGSAETETYKRPSLILRHGDGSTVKNSVYVVVHEPYYGAPSYTVKSFNATTTSSSGSGSAILLEVSNAERKDTVMISLDGEQTLSTGGNHRLVGLAGVISEPVDGSPATGTLYGGTQIRGAGGATLSATTSKWSGAVAAMSSRYNGSSDDTVQTTTVLPTDGSLNGRTIIVNLDADHTEIYTIKSIYYHSASTRYVVQLTDELGFKKVGTNWVEMFYPRRSFPATTTYPNFVIHTAAGTP